jgi:hypothetical protein
MRYGRFLIAMTFLGGPALAQEPAPNETVVQVKCKDGTLSMDGQGACSDHGGLAPADAPPTKRTPVTVEEDRRVAPQTPAMGKPTTVRCKDGTLTPGGQGACFDGGGVDKATSYAPLPVPDSTTRAVHDGEARAYNPKAELTTDPPLPYSTPERVTARCKDGTLSYAKHHSATCSGHAGVEVWLGGAVY